MGSFKGFPDKDYSKTWALIVGMGFWAYSRIVRIGLEPPRLLLRCFMFFSSDPSLSVKELSRALGFTVLTSLEFG